MTCSFPVLRLLSGVFYETGGRWSCRDICGYVFDSYAAYSSMSCILVTLLYSIQIYWDFVGYSFITIGVVRMMGFQLQIHIEKPYFAVSVTDFGWRWYISLSSCSRDYFLYHLVETEWNVGEITGISWRRSSFLVYGMERLIILSFGEDYMGCFKWLESLQRMGKRQCLSNSRCQRILLVIEL